MENKKVLLISNNKLLEQWCTRKLENEFTFDSSSRDSFIYENNEQEKPLLILFDCEGLSFQEICDLIYVSFKNSCKLHSLILVLSSSQKHENFPEKELLAFCSIYFRSTQFSQITELKPNMHKFINNKRNRRESLYRMDTPAKSLKIHSAENDGIKLCAEQNPMKELKTKIDAAARSSANILLLGESGSGKSYTAKLIHRKSSYRQKKMVSINLNEFNEQVLESSLFGTTKGAYTGAEETEGLFSRGNGTTIFIDEIGDISPRLQLKLLSVLENRKFRKVGGTKELSFNSRLIFATNADLKRKIEDKTFRLDLFYRINSITIEIPPLRIHKEDIRLLAQNFAERLGKTISAKAFQKLQAHNYPGNIRELQNLIENASAFCSGKIICAENIRFN